MSSFPGSPQLVKGAIVGIDPLNPVASIVVFQFNPETLTRTITPSTTATQGDRSEALRLKGPPGESFGVDVWFDATDGLETGAGTARTLGVYPQLAALEMLVYPKSALMIANEALASAGVIEVIPPEAPLTIFVWGFKRALPVRVTSITISEEAFDPNLNPILAKATLQLTVLNYKDLGLLSVGGAMYMANQVIKEVMATINGVETLASGRITASIG
jgi:hypothetical protein